MEGKQQLKMLLRAVHNLVGELMFRQPKMMHTSNPISAPTISPSGPVYNAYEQIDE
jgi:hypothetical protein